MSLPCASVNAIIFWELHYYNRISYYYALHLQMEISWNHCHGVTSAQTHFRFSAVMSSFYKQPPYKSHPIAREHLCINNVISNRNLNTRHCTHLYWWENIHHSTSTGSYKPKLYHKLTQWIGMYHPVLLYDICLFKSELGHSWLPCGLLDFCHQMAALLCQSLWGLPSAVFPTLGTLAATLHLMKAGCCIICSVIRHSPV